MVDVPGNSANSGIEFREKRTVPRYSLIATAEVVEPATGVHISGRLAEISRKGCYLDILNTLPVGTQLQLTVSRDQGAFTSRARIIYVQEGMGMGLAFVDVPPAQLTILDAWLAELRV
jgi:PilZ domain